MGWCLAPKSSEEWIGPDEWPNINVSIKLKGIYVTATDCWGKPDVSVQNIIDTLKQYGFEAESLNSDWQIGSSSYFFRLKSLTYNKS
jgi:hypothetical protein